MQDEELSRCGHVSCPQVYLWGPEGHFGEKSCPSRGTVQWKAKGQPAPGISDPLWPYGSPGAGENCSELRRTESFSPESQKRSEHVNMLINALINMLRSMSLEGL